MRWGYDGCGRRVILRGAAPAGLGAIVTGQSAFQWVQPQNLQWFQPALPRFQAVVQPLVSEFVESPPPAPVYAGPDVTQVCASSETEFNSDQSNNRCVRRGVDGKLVAGRYSCHQIETSYQSGRGGVYESPQINPIKYCCSCQSAGLLPSS